MTFDEWTRREGFFVSNPAREILYTCWQAARHAALSEAAEICKGKQVVLDSGEWKLQKPLLDFDSRWHGDVYAAAIERARDGQE